MLRKQNVQLSEENGKLVGHKNHKQRIEYLVKLKKENTKLQEVGNNNATMYTTMLLSSFEYYIKSQLINQYLISFKGK